MSTKKAEKEKQKILDNIRKIVCDKGQTNIFGESVNYSSLESLFKGFLEKSGYIVRAIEKTPSKITKERDLVRFFYNKLDEYKPGILRDNVEYTMGRDESLAKFLVKNRMEALGCSREASLKICSIMIETLIKFEKYYKLTYPVKGFNVFNLASVDWIFRRTEMIRENPTVFSLDTRFEKDEEEFTRKMIEEYGEEYIGFELKEE